MRIELAEQGQAPLRPLGSDAGGWGGVAQAGFGIADRQGTAAGRQEAGTRVAAVATDGDEGGQSRIEARQQMRSVGSEGGMAHRPTQRVGGARQVHALLMRALVGIQRADQRAAVEALRQARQGGGQHHTIDHAGDRADLPLHRPSRLGVEGVEMTHPSRHGQQDERPRRCGRLRWGRRIGGPREVGQ